MSSVADPRTRRRVTSFRPTRDDAVDASFLLALGTLALVGFRSTYSGHNYLLVGVAGLVLGIAIAHLANIFRQPLIVLAVMAVAAFFLLGTALALRSTAGVIPTFGSTRDLADVSVHGWKQLLTTLPPVTSDGPLLVIPYILGLVGGVGGFAIARRMVSVFMPLVAPIGMLVAVVLLGTTEPAAEFLQGAVFAIVAYGWVAVRGLRVRPLVQNGMRGRSRVVTAAVLIGATFVIATVVGPELPGGSDHRVVLRSYVEPPFDINDFASPLVGFRKYRPASNYLGDQELFVVKGLPKGDYVRIATLDDYNGSVWAAKNDTSAPATGAPSDSFQRVGSTIANDAQGDPVVLTVKILPAYASAKDVSAWLPGAGAVSAVEFSGSESGSHGDYFVYNLATNQGIVPDRLRAGDTYTLHTTVGDSDKANAGAPDNSTLPYGLGALDSSAISFTSAQADKWAAGVVGTVPRALAVAKHLATDGAYSDGGEGQAQYLPGHSIGRLSKDFLNDKEPVGDDEQFGAAFALLANELGLPARVVLGAEPDERGVVRGKDVRVWVEVHLADGRWHSIPRSVFMPPETQVPHERQLETPPDAQAAPVPPPNPLRPHAALGDAAQDDVLSHVANRAPQQSGSSGFAIPGVVVAAFKWIGIPTMIVAAICALIVFVKASRRKRRRTNGSRSTRVVQGWNEIVDHARDFGSVVSAGRTRREEARQLERFPVGALASEADARVFGPGEPTEDDVEAFWTRVEEVRRTVSYDATRWQRWRAAVSLRSFVPRQGPAPR